MDIDIGEVLECTCLRMRKATRRITQIYDHALSPTGVTVNQFGLMAHLYGARLAGLPGFSINVLAVRLGADPTTLNRTLKPLQQKDLVRDARDPADRRVRLVQLTDNGRRELAKIMPLWREAQTRVKKMLGAKSMRALNELLDFSVIKLEHRD